VVHESHDILGLDPLNATAGGTVIERRTDTMRVATKVTLVTRPKRILWSGPIERSNTCGIWASETSASLLRGPDTGGHGVSSGNIALVLGPRRCTKQLASLVVDRVIVVFITTEDVLGSLVVLGINPTLLLITETRRSRTAIIILINGGRPGVVCPVISLGNTASRALDDRWVGVNLGLGFLAFCVSHGTV
jgi:hypothetical protein